MASPSKRREGDVYKLLMSDYKVECKEDSMAEFFVEFHGPKDSPYEGGVWKVHVELPDAYPYKSPSIGFVNRIYHPNVDESAGSVCLDIINQQWSPMFDLFNVFDVFLPQLLLYPNPSDPLNGDAAALMMRDADAYAEKVRDYARKYAGAPHAPNNGAAAAAGAGAASAAPAPAGAGAGASPLGNGEWPGFPKPPTSAAVSAPPRGAAPAPHGACAFFGVASAPTAKTNDDSDSDLGADEYASSDDDDDDNQDQDLRLLVQ